MRQSVNPVVAIVIIAVVVAVAAVLFIKGANRDVVSVSAADAAKHAAQKKGN